VRGVTTNIQLNHFELALLEYIYMNPGATSQLALEKTRVDPSSGRIAIRYLVRLGLINIGDGSQADKKLSLTVQGVEMLRQNKLIN
jgi:DNA-binding MarR family transcriptional regulator